MTPDTTAAEVSVLGSCILQNSRIPEAMSLLSAEAFVGQGHRAIWEAIVALNEDGKAVDLLTLSERLRADTELKHHLMDIVKAVPAPANCGHYANIIVDAHQGRRIKLALESGVASMQSGNVDFKHVSATVMEQLLEIAATGPDEAVSARDACKAWIDKMEAAKKDGRPPVASTGLQALDDQIGGYPDGYLTTIGARTTVGKTTLGLIAAEATAKAGKSVLIISLEMAAADLMGKLQGMCGGPNPRKMYRQTLDKDDFQSLSTVIVHLSGLPIWIHDRRLTAAMACARIRATAQRQKDLGLVVVDYLTLLDFTGSRDQLRHKIGAAVKMLRQAARDAGVPIILVSQLNRVPESKDGVSDRPRKHHLRESGDIEQDSDLILLVHRPCMELSPAQYRKRESNNQPTEDDYACIFVDKDRVSGSTGMVAVGWDKGKGTFTDFVPPNVREHLGR